MSSSISPYKEHFASPSKPKTAYSGSRSLGRSHLSLQKTAATSVLFHRLREPSHPYADVSSLLEPNNCMPLWESGDAEKTEVSQELRRLRVKYDVLTRTVRAKERELAAAKLRLGWRRTEEERLEETMGRNTSCMSAS